MPALLLALLAILPAQAPRPALPVGSPTPAEVKASFLKLLDRPKVAPDVRPGQTTLDPKGRVVETLSFASEKKADGSIERVPVLIVRPSAAGRHPAVIVLHGTGGSKEKMRGWLDDLADRGIVGVAIDGRYHGERIGGEADTAKYNAAIVRAWKTPAGEPMEHPFYYDTCWDLWRTVDYLQTRPDVAPDRIGVIGTSKGGIEAWLGAAVDERIRVTVPAIAVQSFRWGLDHDRWQARARTIADAHESAARALGKNKVDRDVCEALWDRVIPGILDRYDGPSMIRLFAGRPLLILNGELDPNCPLDGATLAFESARKTYKDAGCEEKLAIDVAPKTGHAVTDPQRKKALDWFARWLAP